MQTFRTSRIIKSTLLAICSLLSSCERVSNWATGKEDISVMVASLDTADHIVIRNNSVHEVVKETTQPDEIAAVLGLIHKYPTDWKTVMSGALGEYEINFYRGGQLLGEVGLTSAGPAFPGEDTVFVGGAVRQVQKEDVTQLTTKLGLKWPTR